MDVVRLEAGLTGLGIVAAAIGYLLKVAALEFVGIAVACVAFGLLLARALGGSGTP